MSSLFNFSILGVAILSVQLSFAQNLVPNPSFECGQDTCDKDENAMLFSTYACSWFSATMATPDIFSTRLPTTCLGGQPYTGSDPEQLGVQLPHTGNRFAGIFTCSSPQSFVDTPYREYIETALTEPLVVGAYYRASMYVAVSSHEYYAANNLGMCFLVGGVINYTTNQTLNYIPQVLDKTVITSTQWVSVCGVFQATAPSTAVIIGNFFDDVSTQVTVRGGTNPMAENYYNSYYFIDDVSVKRIPPPDSIAMTIAGIQTICLGQTTNLAVVQTYDSITWTALNDTTRVLALGNFLKIIPTTTKTYRAEAKSCGLIWKDTVTIYVNPTPKVNLGADTTLCVGNSLSLNAGPGYSGYNWQNSWTGQFFNVHLPGTYYVSVRGQDGCIGVDSINIAYLAPPIVNLGHDTIECRAFAPLVAFNKRSNYIWSSGSIDSVFTPTSGGTYWVIVTNQCGQSSDTIRIHSLGEVIVPNVVTDNHDGLNDQFKIGGMGDDAYYSLEIFNRWGDQVFFETRYRNSWPPANPDAPSGTYYYLLQFNGCPGIKGWIQVIK